MEKTKLVNKLNGLLLDEMPQYKTQAESFQNDYTSQRRLLRSIMNIRPLISASEELLNLQDKLLSAKTSEKGIVDISKLNGRIVLWHGDITKLNADAIVNAANSKLLSRFYPCHGCIDNAIHSAARIAVSETMKFLEKDNRIEKIMFNVFKDKDYEI